MEEKWWQEGTTYSFYLSRVFTFYIFLYNYVFCLQIKCPNTEISGWWDFKYIKKIFLKHDNKEL